MSLSVEALFQPISLRSVTLPNRIVMAPMTRGFSPGGVPGEDVAQYYRRRAEGGVGLIITEGVGIDHPASIGASTRHDRDIPLLFGDAAMAGWKRVVDEVHAAGGIIFPQLWHMGVMRVDGTGPFPDAPSSRPSGIWGPPEGGRCTVPPESVALLAPPTRPMTESEIGDVIAGYGRSAANAKAVGFDGIAIHGAHGYLIDSFFWAGTNQRTDRYGGDAVARMRFGVEVVKAIRAAIGPALPIVFRYSQWKQQDYDARIAADPQELESLLAPLIEAGVDSFDASTRVFSKPAFPGSDMTLAGWTRKVTGLPSMTVGGIGLAKDLYGSFAGGSESINNLDQVLSRFEQGEFDFVGIGRSLITDPDWTKKARASEPFLPFTLESMARLT